MDDPELDALLQAARPQPDGAWIHATGERLFRRRERRRRTLGLGAALAGGLAALALALSLGGVGPLGGGNAPVQARDRCHTVAVTRVERVPSVVTTRGKTKVVYTRRPVQRTVRHCR